MKPAISYRLLFALLTAAVVLLLSCNPAKKVMDQQQQYERLINDYLVKHPQQIDTITEYIPGKPKLVPVPVPVIDTVVLRKVKDSLQKNLQQSMMIYRQIAAGRLMKHLKPGTTRHVMNLASEKTR